MRNVKTFVVFFVSSLSCNSMGLNFAGLNPGSRAAVLLHGVSRRLESTMPSVFIQQELQSQRGQAR